MQYSVAHFQYHFAESWQQDVFEQALCDLGFDTLDGTDAYIQTSLLDSQALDTLLQDTPEVQLIGIEACADENWNQTWESEHAIQQLPMDVTIVPHCAFGAGHHETTGMMIDALMERDLTGCTVLDNGCGTGVLAIMAKKRGAEHVVAVDIDDHSVQNTLENAQLNNVQLDIQLSDHPVEGQYHLIMSNIHRNILLSQMADYSRLLLPNGELWLSGFYADDVAILVDVAAQHGLQLDQHNTRGDWQMLRLKRSNN